MRASVPGITITVADVDSAAGQGVSRVAGNRFPMALRGYEASAVDAHIDAMEGQLAVLIDQSRSLAEQLTRLEAQLAAAEGQTDGAAVNGYGVASGGGESQLAEAMTESLMIVLRSAHQEAASVLARAHAEAAAIVGESEARRGAATNSPTAGAAAEESAADGPTT